MRPRIFIPVDFDTLPESHRWIDVIMPWNPRSFYVNSVKGAGKLWTNNGLSHPLQELLDRKHKKEISICKARKLLRELGMNFPVQ